MVRTSLGITAVLKRLVGYPGAAFGLVAAAPFVALAIADPLASAFAAARKFADTTCQTRATATIP
jgi:hypothetical protein